MLHCRCPGWAEAKLEVICLQVAMAGLVDLVVVTWVVEDLARA